jgi:hypothetical protein
MIIHLNKINNERHYHRLHQLNNNKDLHHQQRKVHLGLLIVKLKILKNFIWNLKLNNQWINEKNNIYFFFFLFGYHS